MDLKDKIFLNAFDRAKPHSDNSKLFSLKSRHFHGLNGSSPSTSGVLARRTISGRLASPSELRVTNNLVKGSITLDKKNYHLPKGLSLLVDNNDSLISVEFDNLLSNKIFLKHADEIKISNKRLLAKFENMTIEFTELEGELKIVWRDNNNKEYKNYVNGRTVLFGKNYKYELPKGVTAELDPETNNIRNMNVFDQEDRPVYSRAHVDKVYLTNAKFMVLPKQSPNRALVIYEDPKRGTQIREIDPKTFSTDEKGFKTFETKYAQMTLDPENHLIEVKVTQQHEKDSQAPAETIYSADGNKAIMIYEPGLQRMRCRADDGQFCILPSKAMITHDLDGNVFAVKVEGPIQKEFTVKDSVFKFIPNEFNQDAPGRIIIEKPGVKYMLSESMEGILRLNVVNGKKLLPLIEAKPGGESSFFNPSTGKAISTITDGQLYKIDAAGKTLIDPKLDQLGLLMSTSMPELTEAIMGEIATKIGATSSGYPTQHGWVFPNAILYKDGSLINLDTNQEDPKFLENFLEEYF